MLKSYIYYCTNGNVFAFPGQITNILFRFLYWMHFFFSFGFIECVCWDLYVAFNVIERVPVSFPCYKTFRIQLNCLWTISILQIYWNILYGRLKTNKQKTKQCQQAAYRRWTIFKWTFKLVHDNLYLQLPFALGRDFKH